MNQNPPQDPTSATGTMGDMGTDPSNATPSAAPMPGTGAVTPTGEPLPELPSQNESQPAPADNGMVSTPSVDPVTGGTVTPDAGTVPSGDQGAIPQEPVAPAQPM